MIYPTHNDDNILSSYLLKWVLVVLYHYLSSDQAQELDEAVNMTQPDVSEGTVLGIDLVTNVEMERVLDKKCSS